MAELSAVDESISMNSIRKLIKSEPSLHGIKTSGSGRNKQLIINEINQKLQNNQQFFITKWKMRNIMFSVLLFIMQWLFALIYNSYLEETGDLARNDNGPSDYGHVVEAFYAKYRLKNQ